MTLDQIKTAIDAGRTVHWANPGYTVIKDDIGQYLIAWNHGGTWPWYCGLTHADGVTLSSPPEEFFEAAS